MILPVLKLPVVDGDKVVALRRLGRGLCLSFQVAGQPGELLLEPGSVPTGGAPFSFESACGVLTFSNPGPVLSLMGECSLTLAEAGNDPDSWFWALFQHNLSPELLALLGYLRPMTKVHRRAFGCRLTVQLGESRAVALLTLAPDSLLALCESGPWRAVKGSLPGSFPLAVPVLLGRLQLSITQLAGLRSADVLVPQLPAFDVQGNGHLQLGRHRLRGCIDDESGAMRLTVLAIEETAVDEDFMQDSPMHGWDGSEETRPDEPVTDVFGHEPFDELSMTLTVRCGTLQLTLGELRQLAPGVVLGVGGYGPGMAGLYYGDRPIGQGQLVDVDGRLGLQLSRVIFSR